MYSPIMFINNFRPFSIYKILCITADRSIHTVSLSVSPTMLKLTSKEWLFCRGVLQRKTDCILFDPEIHFTNLRNSACRGNLDVLQALGQFSQNMNFDIIQLLGNREISPDVFTPLFTKLTPCIHELPNEQLLQAVKLFAPWAIKNYKSSSDVFSNLLRNFDETCTKRLGDWNLQTLFLLGDVWHFVPCVDNTQMLASIREIIMEQFDGLSPGQALQMVYYLYWMKRSISKAEQSAIENRLKKNVAEMSLDELSIFCIAFFRTDTPIEDKFVLCNIFVKLLETDVKLTDGICLTNILKILRKSATSLPSSTWVVKLQSHLNWNAKYGGLLTAVHISLLGTERFQVYSNSTLETLFRRFSDEADSLRLKDIEKITLVLAESDFKSSTRIEREMCTKFILKLRECLTIRIVSHRMMVIRSVAYMLRVDVYDIELLEFVLDFKQLSQTFDNSIDQYIREVFFIDSYVRINLSGVYNGPILSDKTRKILATRCLNENSDQESTQFKRNFADVLHWVKSLYPQCEVAHSQSHYEQPDIYLMFNQDTKETVSLKNKFPSATDGKIVKANNLRTSGSLLIAIVPTSPSQYQYDLSKYTSYFRCKLNQLEILGFRTIVIPYFEWNKMTPEEKAAFIKAEVFKILDKPVFQIKTLFE